jgi:hypothetical protein
MKSVIMEYMCIYILGANDECISYFWREYDIERNNGIYPAIVWLWVLIKRVK